MVMNILVTGANGFIGSALVKRLLQEGHRVRCLVHRASERLQSLDVDLIHGSVTEPDGLKEALVDIELVYHLAARASDWGSRKLFFEINATGTQNVLDAAIEAKAKRFVLMSSLAVHSFDGYVDADEMIPANQSKYAYGASKVAAEKITRVAHLAGDIETTIVRPGLVIFGPEDTTAFVYMAPMLKKGRWTHVKRGKPLLCYSYVENLADGLLLAGISPQAAGETFVITDDLKLSWRAFISQVIDAFGVKERSMSFPAPVARVAGWSLEMIWRLFRMKDPPPITDYRTVLVSNDFHFGCEKAKSILGYKPQVDLSEGLRRTVEWYCANN
jgi:nucleoside-diphosphate-sugar epimerase